MEATPKSNHPPSIDFQGLIASLQNYWAQEGCLIIQPLDMPVGAGTFHPATFLRALTPQPWNVAYVQPCRRPRDGRYGSNPNRLQHYYQFQVLMKPSPDNIQQMYLQSLQHLGFDPLQNDIRFVEDNWESPSLGAWGLGWEVWLNGMEITQFTYFQQVGGLKCKPVSVELTYGLERLAMYMQGMDNVYDVVWGKAGEQEVFYRQLFHDNERQMSHYQFEHAQSDDLCQQFDMALRSARVLCDEALPLPAYEQVIHASHIFNILEARGTLSVNERQNLILRMRKLSHTIAASYCQLQS